MAAFGVVMCSDSVDGSDTGSNGENVIYVYRYAGTALSRTTQNDHARCINTCVGV